MYKFDRIEEAIIGKTLSNMDSNYGSHIHYWNDEDHDFYYHLYNRLFRGCFILYMN